LPIDKNATKRSQYPITTTLIKGDNDILKHYKLNPYQLSNLGKILNHHKLNLSYATFYLYITANKQEAITILQPIPTGSYLVSFLYQQTIF
jgi:hypothetical protein